MIRQYRTGLIIFGHHEILYHDSCYQLQCKVADNKLSSIDY